MPFNRIQERNEQECWNQFGIQILNRETGTTLGVPSWKLNACIKTLESVRAKDRDFKFVTK